MFVVVPLQSVSVNGPAPFGRSNGQSVRAVTPPSSMAIAQCSISRSKRKGPSNYGDFHFQAVRWFALPPVGSGLKRNLFDVRPLFRLTPAPPRRLWLIRTLSQSPSPTKARTIRSPPILCLCRCRARGSRASRNSDCQFRLPNSDCQTIFRDRDCQGGLAGVREGEAAGIASVKKRGVWFGRGESLVQLALSPEPFDEVGKVFGSQSVAECGRHERDGDGETGCDLGLL